MKTTTLAALVATICLFLLACAGPRGLEIEEHEAPWWFQEAEFSTRATYVAPAAEVWKEEGTKQWPIRGLAKAVAAAKHGDLLILDAGTYDLTPSEYRERIIGNAAAAEAKMDLPVQCGLLIEGKALSIVGVDRAKTIIKTNAGYGIQFANAGRSRLRNLTITGGLRGLDSRSTDAAVIARKTWLSVEECSILDNQGGAAGGAENPGIIGICGREGAELTIRRCLIKGNTWDGIALYRSDPEAPKSAPIAFVEDCEIADGKGVGIGVTWDARAVIGNCKIHGYWKGIGAFGESEVEVFNSLVYEQSGWGVVVANNSRMEVSNCVIYHNGTTGLAAWSESCRGVFRNNIVARNGHAEKEWVGKKCGLWLNSEHVSVLNNCFWQNASFNVCRGGVPEGESAEEVTLPEEAKNLFVDPQFVDAAKQRFDLKAESPLLGAGDLGVYHANESKVNIGLSSGLAVDPRGIFGRQSRFLD